jgi:O-antigen/teichoic acid export membrane protein
MTIKIIDSKRSLYRITKNAASLFSADMIARLSSAFLSVAIIRHLRTSEFGAYSTILGFLLIGGLVAEFGLSQVLVREIAQNKKRSSELFSGAVLALIPLATFASMGSILAALLMGYSSTLTLLLAFATIAIFTNALILLSGAVLRAYEHMGALSVINAFISISTAVLGILWLQNGAKLKELIALLIATSTIHALILLFYIMRRFVSIDFGSAIKGKLSLMKEAVPIAILGLCAVIIQRFDVLLLSKTSGMSAVGIYSSAITIIEALGIFIQSILGAAFPFIALCWKESPMKAGDNYGKILRYFVIVGLPITIGVFMLSDRIVLLLFRQEYIQSAICLKILIWCFMLNSIAGPAGMFLIITKKYLRRFIPYALFITSVSVILNLLLIPRYGYLAASGIALFVSLLLFIVKIVAMSEILPIKPRWVQISWRSMIGAAVMGGGLLWMRNYSLGELVVLGAFTYMITLTILGEFSEEFQVAARYLKGSRA